MIKITKREIKGINSGLKTHHHDQVITPHNLRVIKIRARIDKKFIFIVIYKVCWEKVAKI